MLCISGLEFVSWQALSESQKIQWSSSAWISFQLLAVAVELQISAEQTLLWELPDFLESELHQEYSEHHKTARCEKWLLQNKRSTFTTGSQCLNWKAELYLVKKFLYTSFLTYSWKYNESWASPTWVQFSNGNEKLFLSPLKFQNTKPKKIPIKVKGKAWFGLIHLLIILIPEFCKQRLHTENHSSVAMLEMVVKAFKHKGLTLNIDIHIIWMTELRSPD